MANQVYFILWTEREAYNIRQVYVGGGEHDTVCDWRMVTKRVRWSDEITPARKQQALDYIREYMADDWRIKPHLSLIIESD
jgi:hypothetical protein